MDETKMVGVFLRAYMLTELKSVDETQSRAIRLGISRGGGGQ